MILHHESAEAKKQPRACLQLPGAR